MSPVTTYSYAGLVPSITTLANRTTTTYAYDDTLRLTHLSHYDPNGGILASRTYTYDPASNILSDGQRTYTYDSLDRLTSATTMTGGVLPTTSATYAYDLAGNRNTSTLDSGARSYTVNNLNQYTVSVFSGGVSTGSTAYTYDHNGNLTSNGTYTFVYDADNHLAEVDTSTGILVTYMYDALGRRILKTTQTTQTQYEYA